MSSINDQVYEFYDIVADLRVGSELLEEAAAENMKKRERYLNLCESKDRTAEEEIAANDLRIEANEELEELHAFRNELLSKRERAEELTQSLKAAGFWR